MVETRRTSLAVVYLMVAACSSSSSKPNGASAPQGRVAAVTEGIIRTDDGWVLRTSELSVGPGQESYYCYAATAPEDLKINQFSFTKTLGIHHFMFNEASTPQPDGLTECNIFQVTGETLFTATTASVDLDTPSGSAKLVSKGAQLVLQAHLFNTSDQPIKSVVEIRMTKSPDENPVPVGILGFGSANIVLPPRETTTVESTCVIQEDAHFYAITPHMHYLGTRLELDFGADEQSLKPVYVRDPYSFDDQHFDPFDTVAPAGTMARVRCTYDNTTDETVRFGESSHDEMCNLPGFLVGRDGVKLCTEPLPEAGVPRAAGAAACGVTVTPSGIGKLCTPGGGECDKGLTCSADQLGMAIGICARVGCGSNNDCEGATCCSLSEVSGLANFCVPEGCRPSNCIPVGQQ